MTLSGIISSSYSQPVFARQSVSRSAAAPSSSGYQTATDRVSISSEAKVSLLSGLFPGVGKGAISIEDIEASLSGATSFVEKRIQSIYARLGISPDSRMEIRVDSDGSIRVDGGSPDSERLAEGINSDDELSNSIRSMSANASLLAAIREHEKFAEEYEKNPIAAVERYGRRLGDGHGYNVSFSLRNGSIETTTRYV